MTWNCYIEPWVQFSVCCAREKFSLWKATNLINITKNKCVAATMSKFGFLSGVFPVWKKCSLH